MTLSRNYVSRTSIRIHAPVADIWQALVSPGMAKRYFFGAEVASTWEKGSPITFAGEFQGNVYREKGEILQCRPERVLQYTHWSNLDGLADVPENYRDWTFDLSRDGADVILSVTEDNIPSVEQRERSDQFWTGVLSTIRGILENRGEFLSGNLS